MAKFDFRSSFWLTFGDLKGFFIFVIGLLFTAVLIGCRFGGESVGSRVSEGSLLSVAVPTLTFPLENIYYSAEKKLTIMGVCMDGTDIQITGPLNSVMPCMNSSFLFELNANQEGTNVYLLTQIQPGQTASSPTQFTWVVKSSVAKPQVDYPPSAIHDSSEASLVIRGTCENEATVFLSGDGIGEVKCTNSNFSITLPKFVDGTYNISVGQKDKAGNSASSLFIWNRYAMSVTPSIPQIQAGVAQNLNFAGGGGGFTVSLYQNSSGGSYSSASKQYTAGNTAGVTDILRVVDKWGVVFDMPIQVIAASADHLAPGAASGDLQTVFVSSFSTDLLVAKVVDKFGNPVPYYPVSFGVISGEATFSDQRVQITNLQGEAKIRVKPGSRSTRTIVDAGPVGTILPDEALTNQGRLRFTVFVSSKNLAEFGVNFVTGLNPSTLSASDINSDGLNDIVVLNAGDPSIGLSLKNSFGLFNATTKITGICTDPTALQVLDLNGDNKLDIFTACATSMTAVAQIRFGNGDGTFQNFVNLVKDPGEATPVYSVFSDINSDNKLDLILAQSGTASISVRFGNNDGTFLAPTLMNVGASPNSLIIIDFDKDGKKDILVANSSDNTVTILKGDGLGGLTFFTNIGTGMTPLRLVGGDFNEDTWMDFAIVENGDSNLTVYINDTFGSFNPAFSIQIGSNPNSLVTADLNLDGRLDLIATSGDDSTIYIFYGLGAGLFDVPILLPTQSNPVFVGVGQLNSDSRLDILTLSNGNRKFEVRYNLPSGKWGYEYSTSPGPAMVKTAFVNSDTKNDLVVLNSTSKKLQFFDGVDGFGQFELTSSIDLSDSATRFLAQDLRNLGRTDVVVLNPNFSNFSVLLKNSDGTFTAPVLFTTGSSPSDIVSNDFNRDGIIDIAVTNKNSNSISIFRGDGNGAFEPKVDYLSAAEPINLTCADINNDSAIDIIVANKSSNSVSVFIGNGDGTFRTKVDFDVGNGPSSLVIHDFNNDNRLDLAVLSANDSTIGVLNGSGDGAFMPPAYYYGGANASTMDLLDANSDSKIDLVVGNGASRGFTVLYGSVAGNFNSTQFFESSNTVDRVFVSDVNQDGASDILTLDFVGNRVDLWMGH